MAAYVWRDLQRFSVLQKLEFFLCKRGNCVLGESSSLVVCSIILQYLDPLSEQAPLGFYGWVDCYLNEVVLRFQCRDYLKWSN